MSTQTIRMSATKARNNFFDLLNQVALGISVVIEKDKKVVAELRQPMKVISQVERLNKVMKEVAGTFPKDAYKGNDNIFRNARARKYMREKFGKW